MLTLVPVQSPMTAEDEAHTFKRIDRGKVGLMMERGTTFFSALLANLKLVMDRGKPTAATDGVHLWMNPDFVCKQSEDQLIGLLLHEVMHVSLDHCNFEIYKDLNQYVLGIAMDHHINLYITALGYILPEGGYCDRKYTGWSSMRIYEDLMKNPPKPPPSWQPDVFGKPPGMSAEEYKDRVDTNIIKAVLQAQMANDPGSIPAHIKLKVEELISPQLPWNLILLKYMDQYKKDDYSFRRPNRRYVPNFYMPFMQSESLEGVTFVLDVSGSMTDGDLDEGLAECRYIRDLLAPEWIHMMTIDTMVHLDKIFDPYDELPKAEIEGGGGTVLDPVIARIVEYKPQFAIIFTDGYFGTLNMTGVESDIYWVIKGNPGFRPPDGIGEVIHLN